MDVDDVTLRKIQLIRLIGLLEIKRICDKYDIKYTLLFGTLLGAVRHQGFIPWDDDIDIGMRRDDLNKFIDICNTELSSNFKLDSAEHNPGLFMKGMKFLMSVVPDSHPKWGGVVDIYPIDSSPNGLLQMKIHKLLSSILMNITYARYGWRIPCSSRSRIVFSVWKLLSFPYRKEVIRNLYYKEIKKYNSKNTDYAVITGRAYDYLQKRYPRYIVDEYDEIEFEGFPFLAIKNYDAHLSSVYGDYMTPVSIESREGHDYSVLDLGQYQDMNAIIKEINSYKI